MDYIQRVMRAISFPWKTTSLLGEKLLTSDWRKGVNNIYRLPDRTIEPPSRPDNDQHSFEISLILWLSRVNSSDVILRCYGVDIHSCTSLITQFIIPLAVEIAAKLLDWTKDEIILKYWSIETCQKFKSCLDLEWMFLAKISPCHDVVLSRF